MMYPIIRLEQIPFDDTMHRWVALFRSVCAEAEARDKTLLMQECLRVYNTHRHRAGRPISSHWKYMRGKLEVQRWHSAWTLTLQTTLDSGASFNTIDLWSWETAELYYRCIRLLSQRIHEERLYVVPD